MTDMECMVDFDMAANSETPMGSPVVPPQNWFEELPDEADPRVMAGVIMCGPDRGRFWTMIGEDDVPYMTVYDDIDAPIAEASTSYYMNKRLENPLTVLDADGNQAQIAAGPIGFGHSPESIVTLNDLYTWHDREWGTAAKERPLARARLYTVGGPEGRVVVASGALMPDVTWAEAVAVLNSEVSPEFMGVYDDAGEVESIEWVTQTLVFLGNTRTSLSTSERVERGRLRLVANNPSQGEPKMKTELEIDVSGALAEVRKVADAVQDLHKACGDTPCEPCAQAAAAEAEEAATVEEQLAEVTAERDELLAAEFEAIEVDASPLQRARINTDSELRQNLNQVVWGTYDSPQTDSYVIDRAVGENIVYFEVYHSAGSDRYRQGFQISEDGMSVELVGEPVRGDFDMMWNDAPTESAA